MYLFKGLFFSLGNGRRDRPKPCLFECPFYNGSPELDDGRRVALEPVLGHSCRGEAPPFENAAPGDGTDYGYLLAGDIDDGIINATSQQYPLLMASLGLEAIKEIAEGGAPPENTSADGTFFDTGVALCTDDPMDTVTVAPQEDSQYCIDNAWG